MPGTPDIQPVTIFLSAVTCEFHQPDPCNPQAFRSYRDALAESLRAIRQPHAIIITADDLARRADPHTQPGRLAVISQENLAQGFGDLLETLENEVRFSSIIVHLIGDMVGFPPTGAELRRLHQRQPSLLDSQPELRAQLGDLAGYSYTQWEIYLAYHYDARRLVFKATATAPRCPPL